MCSEDIWHAWLRLAHSLIIMKPQAAEDIATACSAGRVEKRTQRPPGSGKWCSSSSVTLSFLFLSIPPLNAPSSLCLPRRKPHTICLCREMAEGSWWGIALLEAWICVFSSPMLSRSWKMCCDWLSGKYIVVCYCCCSSLLSWHLETGEWNCQTLTLCRLTFFLLSQAAQILVVMFRRFLGQIRWSVKLFLITCGCCVRNTVFSTTLYCIWSRSIGYVSFLLCKRSFLHY